MVVVDDRGIDGDDRAGGGVVLPRDARAGDDDAVIGLGTAGIRRLASHRGFARDRFLRRLVLRHRRCRYAERIDSAGEKNRPKPLPLL